MANNEELQEHVKAWVAQRPRADVLADLYAHEVVAAPVNDASDIVEDPHFRERTLVELRDTVLGSALMPGPVLRMGEYPGPLYQGVPALGQHTDSALVELLTMSSEELDLLAGEDVIGRVGPRAA